MKALVLGASGFLGSSLGYFLTQIGWRVSGVTRTDAPFFPDLQKVASDKEIDDVLREGDWDVILNAIALASHEECERNPDSARHVNTDLPARWADIARSRGIPFVHFSTDAVFEGCHQPPYAEEDTPCPIGVYAKTKREGENAVVGSNPDALVVRTNFYGWSSSGTKGILDFFVSSLESNKEVVGFTDYVVSSLYVGDLAETCVELVKSGAQGIFHVVARDSLSKFDFGQEVARFFELDASCIKPGSLDNAGLAVPRGKDLSLSTEKISGLMGHLMPTSSSGLARARADREAMRSYFSGRGPS